MISSWAREERERKRMAGAQGVGLMDDMNSR